MQIALPTAFRKALFLSVSLSITASYAAFVTRDLVASYFSQQPDSSSLRQAILLEPARAEFQYRLGHAYSHSEPETALQFYKSAAALNPHRAVYWLDLASAYLLVGDAAGQATALHRALADDPKSPAVAWDAANQSWASGDIATALQEFRVVLENDPYLPPQALERCWQIRPDADALLRDVIPRRTEIYSEFLAFLVSRKESSAAARVWNEMAQLHQSVERRYVFDYVGYLLDQRDTDQAREVWEQAASLSDLSAYQPSSQNFVVNSEFALPLLNAGFDWRYERKPDVTLALDPNQPHSGHNSLSIALDSQGLDDLGIRQLIPIAPNTRYAFSAFFKADDVQGAGGPQFVIQDEFQGNTYFASEDLKDADAWKQVLGSFTTTRDARLLSLRLLRVPARHAIRGKLWIDNLRLIPQTEDAH